MTYREAIQKSRTVGASKAEGLPYLAMVCATLALVHSVVPNRVYDGARKRGLDGDAVRKLDPVALGDLMFD